MDTKSGAVILDQTIEHLDDLTSLISFVEEKLETYVKLQIILLGFTDEKHVIKDEVEEPVIVPFVVKTEYHSEEESSDGEHYTHDDYAPVRKKRKRIADTDDDYKPEKWHKRTLKTPNVQPKKKPKSDNEEEKEFAESLKGDPEDPGFRLVGHTEVEDRNGVNGDDGSNSASSDSKSQSVKCSECPRQFTQYCNMYKHVRQVHGVEPTVRPSGSLAPSHKFNKENYKKKGPKKGTKYKKKDFDKDGDFICDDCGETCHGYITFKKHRAKHLHADKVRELQCPFCLETLNMTHKQYSRHKYNCEAQLATGAEHMCENCGKAFPTYRKMKTHHGFCSGKYKGNYPAKKIPCPYEGCSYEAHGKSHLDNHINKVHLNLPITQDFVCPTCGAAYNKKAHLNMHIKAIHLNIKPHVCDTCGKSFAKKQILKEHQEIHSGVLRHKCHWCDKAYNNNGSKWNHMRSCSFNPDKL